MERMIMIVLVVYIATLAGVIGGEEGGEIATTQAVFTSATTSYFPGKMYILIIFLIYNYS